MDIDDEGFKGKIIKYSIIGFVALIVFLFLLVIYTSFSGKKKTINNVEKSITLTSGEKYSVNYKDYTWTSSDNSVAIINNNGEIEALKDGNTKITVTTDGEVVTFDVSVKKIDDSVILVNIKMEKNTIELEKDETYTMKVNLIPNNASSSELSWYSSNESVATVENGTIKAISSGTAMITVKSSNGNTDTCLVKVKGDANLPVGDLESISFDTTSLVLKKDIMYTINYVTTPSDVNGNIVWDSSDTDVVTIENGVIKTVGVGTSTITAKSGEIEDTMYVTVVEGDSDTPDVIDDGKEVKATAIALNQQEIVLSVNDSYNLAATVSPDNTTNKEVSFSSSNSNVAAVNSEGKVEALNEGEATITVKSANDLSATCNVIVKKVEEEEEEDPDLEEQDNIVEHFVSLNLDNVSLNVGDTAQLVETISPENKVSSVYWYSSNPSVVKVEKGKITALEGGTAYVTAELPNGNDASCFISVSSNKSVVKALLVSLNAKQVNLKTGGTFNFTASILPSNTTNKTITWSSSNTSIVTIDNNGKATARSSGSVIITAKSSNGVVATATVTVASDPKAQTITLNKQNLSLQKGQTETLVATITPSTVKNEKITWSSSNTKVAVVDSNGKVKAVGDGTAAITAKTSNGKIAKATVTVGTAKKNIEMLFVNTNIKNGKVDASYNDESVIFKVDDKIVMIDTGINGKYSIIKNRLKELSGQSGKITIDYLIISHSHSDHIGNLDELIKDSNITIKNVIYKSSAKVTNILKKAKNVKNIIKTNNLAKNNKYYSIKINDKVKLTLFNLTSVYEGKNCSNVCSNGEQLYRVMLVKGASGSAVKYGGKYIVLDKNGDNIKNDVLKYTTEKNNSNYFYATYYSKVNGCGANANSIASLFEITTNNGKKFVYVPADLENNGYAIYDENNGSDYGYVYWFECNKKGLAKKSTNSLHGVTTKKVSSNTFKVVNKVNPVKASAEVNVAQDIANYFKSNNYNLNNITIYQASHHGRDNSPKAMEILNLNRSDLYNVIPGTSTADGTTHALYYKNYKYTLGKTKKLIVGNKPEKGIYCYIRNDGSTNCSVSN